MNAGDLDKEALLDAIEQHETAAAAIDVIEFKHRQDSFVQQSDVSDGRRRWNCANTECAYERIIVYT
jgi:hypothetical protein